MINHYENFVTLNRYGGPDHLKSRSALPHLYHLVHNMFKSPILQRFQTVKKLCNEEKCYSNSSYDGVEKNKDGSNQQAGISGVERNNDVNTCSKNLQQPQTCHANLSNDKDESSVTSIDSISLVAFSKGCVVLNQLVTEIFLMAELPNEERVLYADFLQKVR